MINEIVDLEREPVALFNNKSKLYCMHHQTHEPMAITGLDKLYFNYEF
jgi:hypothetical protein